MAFSLPSLKDLVQRARNSFRTEMPGSDAWVWPNNVYVTSKVFGGLLAELFRFVKWIDKQRFAMTATGYWLEMHGQELGIGRKPARNAYGPVYVTGTAGATVDAGTTFTRSDGALYTSDVPVVLSSAGTARINVTCSATGAAGNAVFGTELTCSNAAVTGATVDEAGIGQGDDVEDYESLRSRILFRKRSPPQGGCENDYKAWAEAVSGVTRVWVEGNYYGLGTVAVWFTMDRAYTYGVPQATDVAAVQAYIDSVRPVTATVTVAAPSIFPIDVVVSDISPNTTAIKQDAANEIRAAVMREAAVSTTAKPVSVYVSSLWAAVSAVTGEKHHSITSPTSDLTVPAGYLPVVRSVSFVFS